MSDEAWLWMGSWRGLLGSEDKGVADVDTSVSVEGDVDGGPVGARLPIARRGAMGNLAQASTITGSDSTCKGRFDDRERGDGGGPGLKGPGDVDRRTQDGDGCSLEGEGEVGVGRSLLATPSLRGEGNGGGDLDGLRLGPDGKFGAILHDIDENRGRGEDGDVVKEV